MGLGAMIATLMAYVLAARNKPELAPWHRVELDLEASQRELDKWDLDRYLAREDELFSEMQARLGATGDEAGPLGRFNPQSPTHPASFPTDFNRTFELAPALPIGGALLLHGLSDSPYSVRATAEVLAGQGYYCLALRLPGHGTLPGELTPVSWRDWIAAVRLGVRAVSSRLEPGQPFILMGYSNGAALALGHALDAFEDDELRAPDRLVFLSPALAVKRVAALARWQKSISRLPGLEKLAWNSVLPETDPYKYNSFAVNAAEQIYRLTTRIETQLADLASAGRTEELPPVLTFQSVVDATVPPISSLSRLYDRLPANGSALVLFDVNRAAEAESFLKPGVDELLRQAQPDRTRSFSVTLVTNASARSRELVAKTKPANSLAIVSEPLELSWPDGVYSLSHVSIPFPPDDPIYGSVPGRFPFPFGRLEPRGERGALQLPMTLLMRLRNNPFFPYLERRVVEFVD